MSSGDHNDDLLGWDIVTHERILNTRVFDVFSQHEKAHAGIEGDYIAVNAPNWIVTVPVIDGNFVMVRQFRHAYGRITMEMPGGVGEIGEDPKISAARELEEETGYRANKITCLGSVSPNPALFMNKVYFYLAEDLEKVGNQKLDDDEVLNYMLVPINEVIEKFGNEEYAHAFMGTAIMMYLRHLGKTRI